MLETSVLRTLCLTFNSKTSEHRATILDTLSENDFYFPITKTVYITVLELHRQGVNITAEELQDALRRRSVHVPDDFFIEDLFLGDIPALDDLRQSLLQLKNGPDSGPTIKDEVTSTHPSIAKPPEKVSSLEEIEVPPPTPPSLTETEDPDLEISVYPPASEATVREPERAPSGVITQVCSVSETRRRAVPRSRAGVGGAPPNPIPSKPRPPAQPKVDGGIVSPESSEWLDYLDELTSKQGKRLVSGFAGLDDTLGGLRPGLMLLADENQDRARDFLKQITDQIAVGSNVPCLYVSFWLSKELLRLRTLSRLAGVPSKEMEKGSFEKDSPEWKKVLSAGRQAIEWLERVFVVEADAGLGISGVRDMSRRILDSHNESMGLIALDSFERLGGQEESIGTLAELKELSQSRALLVIAAADDLTLLSQANADISARLRSEGTDVELEITQSAKPQSLRILFHYQPETHQFLEKTRSS